MSPYLPQFRPVSICRFTSMAENCSRRMSRKNSSGSEWSDLLARALCICWSRASGALAAFPGDFRPMEYQPVALRIVREDVPVPAPVQTGFDLPLHFDGRELLPK